MNNRMKIALLAVSTALLAGTTGPSLAVTCFEVIDRSDALIYRDITPPVDLSTAGASAREAMRARGETLVFFDTEACIIMRKAGATKGRPLTTEEIIAEWRAFGRSGDGAAGAARGGVPAAVPTAASGPATSPASATTPAAGPATDRAGTPAAR